eukprot:4503829-Pleurochrysis_carterae.AAC.1
MGRQIEREREREREKERERRMERRQFVLSSPTGNLSFSRREGECEEAREVEEEEQVGLR